MKILNLYAGIGGNRKLWGDDHDITAIEYDQETANVYQDYFPQDNMIVTDAHQYLLDHYKEYDFIWSSPPCPSHSKINFSMTRDLEFPDMKLYEEIIFLKTWYKGKFVVENVIPYYPPLIPAKEVDRHLFWANFNIGNFILQDKGVIRRHQIPDYEKLYGYDLSNFKLKDKRKRLRNCVNPKTGKYILDCAMNVRRQENLKQTELF